MGRRLFRNGGPRRCIRAFQRDQRGATMVLMAIGLFASAGMAALAIDMGYFYLLKGRLQTTADVSALAAIRQLPNQDALRASALEYAPKNMAASEHGSVLVTADVVPGHWASGTRTFTAAANPVNAVQVTTRRSQANGNTAPTFFAHIIGFDGVDIMRSAIAAGSRSQCVVALGETGNTVHLNSNSAINVDGCTIQVNSSDDYALTTNSGSSVTADSTCVTGDYNGSGYSPPPITDCSPVPDPLADLAAPSYGSCDHTDYVVSSGIDTLSPGVYCGKLEINSSATAILDPGVYIMDDATFIANSDSTILGDDVTIYLTGSDGYLLFNSDSTVRLSASLTGPMAGIVVYQDRNVADGTVHLINSDSASYFEGTVYLPNGKVMINSGSSLGGNAAYSIFIAKEYEINSDSTLVMNSDFGGSDVPLPAGLRDHLVR